MLSKYVLLSLRPKQWVKNMFIFLPLIFGKKLFDFPTNLYSVVAFCIFSLAASVAYLTNDIVDIQRDKIHPAKRLRPVASGKVNIKLARNIALILGIITIYFSFTLNSNFGLIILIYLMFNFLYSKSLKNIVIVDVFCLGFFLLFRIIAGGIIAQVTISHWIIIMIVLLSQFLGFNKRRQELKLLKSKASSFRQVLNKYNVYFIDQMIAIIASSVLVTYTLYTVDARTVHEFGSKNLVYSIPFVYYGIFRYLYLIHRVHRDGDPTRILLTDTMLQIDIILWISVCIMVIYCRF